MKIKQTVWWRQCQWEKEPVPVIGSESFGASFPEYIAGETIEIEIGEPPGRADIVKAQVSALKKEQGELMARYYGIDRQIAELLCIEDKSAEVVS